MLTGPSNTPDTQVEGDSGGVDAGAAAPTPTHFIVQEYLEGDTLREPLKKGALPVKKALALATEIAEALAAAHSAGIIHRDLKPENIFITKEGHAKVLDFGLAKLMELAPAMSPGTEASKSPTMLGTVAGQVMGTAGYMAPEQVQGDGEIDQRADLFAFGCVLYETVTGRQAFAGKNVFETLGQIVGEDPDSIGEIDAELPADLQRAVKKCLAKDPRERYQDADDLLVDLRSLAKEVEAGTAQPLSGDVPAVAVTVERVGGNPWKLAAPLAAATALATALAVWFVMQPEPQPPMRFEIELPEDVNFSRTGARVVAVSPDGTRIAFTGNEQLWIRSIDVLEPTPLRGTDDPVSPFFSPDGQQLGFFSAPDNQIKRVAVTGGAPVSLAPAVFPFGTSWAEDGMIYYGQGTEGIWRVSENGGDPENIISLDSGAFAHGPQLLPGGEWVLFTVATNRAWNDGSIVAQSLTTEQRVELISGGTEGRYVPTGHIVYVRDGTLFAVPFDLGAMEVTSGPASMVEGIRTTGGRTGAANYGLTSHGGLVYVPGAAAAGGGEFALEWMDRDGNAEPLPLERRTFNHPRLSPDESRIAVEITEGDDTQVWIYEVERGGSQRLTSEGNNRGPLWSPDGEWVYFQSDRAGDSDIWRKRADLSADAEVVLEADGRQVPWSISADGTVLLFTDQATGPPDVKMLSLEGDSEPESLIATEAATFFPWVSPDGRFFAFQSDETGNQEISVMEVSTKRRWPMSTADGANPVWSRDGSEIFYNWRGSWYAVAVTAEPDFSALPPRRLFELPPSYRGNFDVSADGQRFLMVQRGEVAATGGTPSTPRINVVLNWFEELKQRVPGGR